jgi:RimJ/RimL family protein N-acetyltransferase
LVNTAEVDLKTERLIMRPVRDADLDDLVALHADPVVLRWFGPATREELADWIAAARESWAERGHGRAVTRSREDGTFLGRGGLRHWPQFDEVEVGWTLTAAARGRGIATEAGHAWLEWGLRELDVPYITAMIDPANTTSIAVAERLGMESLRTDVLHGKPVTVYARRR